MLNSHVHKPVQSKEAALLVIGKPFVLSNVKPKLPVRWEAGWSSPAKRNGGAGGPGLRLSRWRCRNVIRASATVESSTEMWVSAKAVVTVKETMGGFFNNFRLDRRLDDITDLMGKSLLLELVSAHLDHETGIEKAVIESYAHKSQSKNGETKYETKLKIPSDFGPIGAIFVQNDHCTEMYLKDIVIDGIPTGPVHFSCNSWVHPVSQNQDKRVFFTTKSYIPSKTPDGLKRFREEELGILQGNGQGERKSHDRIYDYDVYNDLGDPDKGDILRRPVLGGKLHPYPRRCRTGRPRSRADRLSEQRSSDPYVPRDESFSKIKQASFLIKSLYSAVHALEPALEVVLKDSELSFLHFSANLYREEISLPPLDGEWNLANLLPRLVDSVAERAEKILRFPAPETFDRDKFFWFRDEEFARQTLAGLNPYSIKLVTEWPLKSNLDPAIYGPPESAITDELIEQQIKGFMTLDQALKQKKLFILDYHDLFLPYVEKVRSLENRTLYGSRTLFFLTPENILRPLAIELTRPPIDEKPQWKQVFTPCSDATGIWLWRIAKAHVLAHDSGYHQLVSHWLRTHCCVEPYIIATNRQLSAMHPIHRLLDPHFRYTMEINALAREALINAGGIIESSFSPGKYSLEFSSVAYDKQWQFNLEALPADLIHRGLAVEDPNSPHGLKLAIEDYPFANDGLILWDALKQWATDYVNHYYPDPDLVNSDEELQAWWTEIRTVGHGDKKDETWWPELNKTQDLIDIATTIMWVTSGHHAAVNVGQNSVAGIAASRPSIAKINMPTEELNPELWNYFLEKPEKVLLDTSTTKIQVATVVAILRMLSSHSPYEECLGQNLQSGWANDPVIKGAFDKFSGKLKELEKIIDERNADSKLKNRYGAGVEPYQIMKQHSEPGEPRRRVPSSISN